LATLTPTEPPDPPTDSLPWGAGFALAGTPFLASAIALGLVVLWQMIVGQSLVETASDCTRVAMMTFAFGIAPALMLQVPIDAFGRKHALANDARLALQAASVSVPYFGLPFALDGLLRVLPLQTNAFAAYFQPMAVFVVGGAFAALAYGTFFALFHATRQIAQFGALTLRTPD
jgi:hypothetical protein